MCGNAKDTGDAAKLGPTRELELVISIYILLSIIIIII
jgi:hypothetical protein